MQKLNRFKTMAYILIRWIYTYLAYFNANLENQ